MRHTGRKKHNTGFFELLRQRKRRHTRRVQGGGGQDVGLLDHADAPAVVPQGNIDFNVRFQPTVKANEWGPKFTTYQVAHEPYPVWTPPTPPTKYTIVCWDPDVTEGKSFLHWLVVNCSGGDNADGKVIASWYPPSPPPGAGQHRYVIGLMAQKGDLQIPEITDRLNFNAANFATTNSLSPIAYRGFRVETPPIFVPEPSGPKPPPQPVPPPQPQPAAQPGQDAGDPLATSKAIVVPPVPPLPPI